MVKFGRLHHSDVVNFQIFQSRAYVLAPSLKKMGP
uniref:Uncharacterized protein n=1 Tax=Arundo donax TaxID=35708 RepID=A0A0A8Y8V3_ARUDO